jgi:HlyD family secretion protein
MANNPEKTKKVSDQDVQNLQKFAEINQQNTKMSEVMDKVPSIVQRGAVYLIAGALIITWGLLYFGKAPVTIAAKGKIVPKGKAFSVQAPDSGMVTEVLVKVGERMPEGAPLFRLDRSQDPSQASADLNISSIMRQLELQKKQLLELENSVNVSQRILSGPMDFLRLNEHVIADGRTMQKINALRKSWMEMNNVQQLNATGFKDKKEQMAKEIELVHQRIKLLEKNKSAAILEYKEQEEALPLRLKNLEETRKLVERGIISEIEYQADKEKYRAEVSRIAEMKKNPEQIELEISNKRLNAADMQIKVQTEEADTSKQYRIAKINFDQNITDLQLGLNELNSEINKLGAEIKNNNDKLGDMKSKMILVDILMPIAGTIVKLEVVNPGEMISVGKVVAAVAPDGEPLVVSAAVPNKDIGFVDEGLAARIKVDAFPFEQFGVIPGKVLQIFPNIGDNESFTITLELLQDHILTGNRKIPLFSGLTVQVELITRKQRLINLILGKDKEEKKGK